MSRWRIEFESQYRSTPVSYWAHHHKNHEVWAEASQFEPPLPKAIPGKGFPRLIIDAFGTDLEFASVTEAVHFRQVIEQKNMPSTLQLSKQRQSSQGPNSHWLSRLPGNLKPWRKREKLLPILDEGIRALEGIYQ